jgi:sterol 3beta-glucosyltransferase
MIFDAVKVAGVRALVSAGWGGLGGAEVPEGVFILKGLYAEILQPQYTRLMKIFTGSIPHDWLFAEGRVSAVCHHGGQSACSRI